MADVKPIAPVRIGGTDIHYAQGVRAGPWLFFTGHMATDFEHGLAASVAGKPGLPLGGAPRYRREGDFIIDRFTKLIAAEGGDLRHIVRVDQYYPSAQVVNAYQRARKLVLKDYVPPSTSVLMEELLVGGATMDVSMLAVLPGDGREPKAAKVEGVPVPPHSGFIPSLVMGDYVFVAGQMPNNVAMTGLEPPAYRPPNAVWNGTDIRLQAEFLITGRLKPALEAGGSSLRNAVKAQVYLYQYRGPARIPRCLERPFRRQPLRADRGGDQGARSPRVDHRDQYFRRARCRQHEEADHRPQAVCAYAARAGRRPRGRSAMPVGALCRG